MKTNNVSKYFCLLSLLLLLHGCSTPMALHVITLKRASTEPANSSIVVSAASSIKSEVLEMVDEVSSKYKFQKTTGFSGISKHLLSTYRLISDDGFLLMDMYVHEDKPNSFSIVLLEHMRITQGKTAKEIKADLVNKFSERFGKEYVITTER